VRRRELFGLVFVVFLLGGCSHPHYSPKIKEVVTPLQSNLKAFYQQYKRFPNDAERDALLEKSGCKVKNNRCYYRGYSFLIESELYNGYLIILKLKGSSCLTDLLFFTLHPDFSKRASLSASFGNLLYC